MLYDYKSEEIVQDVITDCLCPIVDDIVEEHCNLHRYEDLSIYAPSYIAREILGRILDEIDELWVDEKSDMKLIYRDDAEVLITISYDDNVFVEKARSNNGSLKMSDSSLIYVYDTFSSNDVNWLSSDGNAILVFGLKEEDFDDDDCDNFHECYECEESDCPEKYVEYSKDNDGNMHGFTASRSDGDSYYSYSVYTSNELSFDDIQSLLKNAGF